MIGIPCFGLEHQQRVWEAINKLTPEVYLMFMEARNLVSKRIDCPSDFAVERDFIDRIDVLLARNRLPNEQGDFRYAWFDGSTTE